MIQIIRKEQQVLRNLKNVMAAEQAEFITGEMLRSVDPGQDIICSLIDKDVLVSEDEKTFITKEQLQVQDDDPEVEAAWQACRDQVPSRSLFDNLTKKEDIVKANRNLEKVLFEKGRLTHLVKGTDHIWVTDDKVEDWVKKGWKGGYPGAIPGSRD